MDVLERPLHAVYSKIVEDAVLILDVISVEAMKSQSHHVKPMACGMERISRFEWKRRMRTTMAALDKSFVGGRGQG